MAYREFQTAASRVVHLVNPTDGDMQRLTADLSFHPLDLEAGLSTLTTPRVGSYRQYVSAALPWPALDRGGHRLVMSQIQLFIGQTFLVIIEHDDVPSVADTVEAWAGDPTNADHPALLAYDLLLGMTKETVAKARAVPAADWRSALAALPDAVTSLRHLVDQQGWLNDDGQNAYAYLTYLWQHITQELEAQPVAANPRPLRRSPIQGVVASYALASAIMTVVVLLIISFRR